MQVDGEPDDVGTWDEDSRSIVFYADEAAADDVAGVAPVGVASGAAPLEQEEEDEDAETLDIFCSATGADEDTGRKFILDAGGDLDEAINLFYAGEDFDDGDGAEAPAEAVSAGPASDDIVVVFSEQGRLGVNFGDKGKTWPNGKYTGRLSFLVMSWSFLRDSLWLQSTASRLTHWRRATRC